MAELLSPEVLVVAAAQQDVSYRLSPLSTMAPRVVEARDATSKEAVLESDLLGPHLYEQGALRFA